MNFSSITFAFFMFATFLLYWKVHEKYRGGDTFSSKLLLLSRIRALSFCIINSSHFDFIYYGFINVSLQTCSVP